MPGSSSSSRCASFLKNRKQAFHLPTNCCTYIVLCMYRMYEEANYKVFWFLTQHTTVRVEGAPWYQHEQSLLRRNWPPEEFRGPKAVSTMLEQLFTSGTHSSLQDRLLSHCSHFTSLRARYQVYHRSCSTIEAVCPLVEMGSSLF